MQVSQTAAGPAESLGSIDRSADAGPRPIGLGSMPTYHAPYGGLLGGWAQMNRVPDIATRGGYPGGEPFRERNASSTQGP